MIIRNEFCNLYTSQIVRHRAHGEEIEHDIDFSGMLFRTFCELDLLDLMKISEATENKKQIPNINIQTLISCFGGHTLFTIF